MRDGLAAALLAAARNPAVQDRQAGASVAPRPMTREEYLAALRAVRPGIGGALQAAGVVCNR